MIEWILPIIGFVVLLILFWFLVIVPQQEAQRQYELRLPELCTHDAFYYGHLTSCDSIGVKP